MEVQPPPLPSTRQAELPAWPCAGLRLDARGHIVRANRALANLVGIELNTLVGLPFDSLLTGASRVLYQSYLHPVLRMHGHVEEISLTLKRANAEPVDVLFYSARTPAPRHAGDEDTDATAEPGAHEHTEDPEACVDVILATIRRRRGIEEEMLRIKRAADQAPGMIFQWMQLPSGEQHFPFVSEAVRNLYGVTPEQVSASAQALLGRVHADDLAPMIEAMHAAAAQGTDWTGAYRVPVSDGTVQWHEMHATPRDLAGGVRVWHGHIADISQRRTMELALAERTAADRMNEMRSEFLARVSHELRTPLNGIIGFTELISSDPTARLSDVQRNRLAVISASGQHLLHLVNQVLDISSLESLQAHFDLLPVRVNGAVQVAMDLMRAQADASGIRLQLEANPDDLWVHSDVLRLRQVLVNLLSNALKYNRPNGSVQVRVARVDEQIAIAITDCGIGMSPQQQAQLFQPFNRLGAENSGTEGSGLGLVITRNLLAMMGGSVLVHSVQGEGSTFTCLLPACEAPPTTAHAATAEAAADSPLSDAAAPGAGPTGSPRGRVMCVEDNPVNALLMEAVFGLRPNVTLLLVPNGTRALQAVQDFDPDLLLLDMHLPDMQGSELLARIRAMDLPRQVPALAVSAAARPDDIRSAMALGFDGYWTKPLDIDCTLADLDRRLQKI